MNKKLISVLLVACFLPTFASNSSDLTATPADTPLPTVEKPLNKQIGVAVEERSPLVDTYIYFNQKFSNNIFYQLRAYYIHDYITNSAPAKAVPRPDDRDQESLNGTGGVFILGRIFSPNPDVKLSPFVRLQYLTNTVMPYKDSLGNEISSKSGTAYLGLNLAMKINEKFSDYIQYYAGYQRTNLDGEGYFSTSGDPAINSLTSTLEIGLPYKLTNIWTATPFVQWITTTNNPNNDAFNAPISASARTSTGAVYGFKIDRSFS